MNFDLDKTIENPEQARAHEAAKSLQRIHELVRVEMTAAQYRQSKAYDRTRRPAPKFEPGDRVWLDARHIKTTRPVRKLDWKRLGPFPVKRAIGSHAYELDLPADIRIHPVQPVSLLDTAAGDPLPGQIVPPPPPVTVEGEPEYHVEAVEDSRMSRKTLQYRVRWVGWAILTWEPWYFVNTTEAVACFHKQYPEKPGPMHENSEIAELRHRGLNLNSLAGARPLGRGNCHGAAMASPDLTRPQASLYETAGRVTTHRDAPHSVTTQAPLSVDSVVATTSRATPTIPRATTPRTTSLPPSCDATRSTTPRTTPRATTPAPRTTTSTHTMAPATHAEVALGGRILGELQDGRGPSREAELEDGRGPSREVNQGESGGQ